MTSPAALPTGIEIGDRKAALGWIRRSRLPKPTQLALARFVRRFGEMQFYRELPEHHDAVEALLGRRLPRWYRRIRSTLALFAPGEAEAVYLEGAEDNRYRFEWDDWYRFDLCGADPDPAARPRRPIIPLARGVNLDWVALGIQANRRSVWRRAQRKSLAYADYPALLGAIVGVRTADGRVLWAPSRSGAAWCSRGTSLEEEDPERAIDALSRAVALAPRNKDAWFHLGRAYQRADRLEEALEALQRCVARPGGDEREYWWKIGFVLHRLQRPAEALEAFDRAIAIGPGSGTLLYNRGVVLTVLERFDEALAAFLEAVALDPGYSSAWLNAGFREHHRGNYAAAVDIDTRGLEHCPQAGGLWFNRACAYAMLGERAAALSDLAEAVRLDPKYAADARTDDALASLWDDTEFLALTEGESGDRPDDGEAGAG